MSETKNSSLLVKIAVLVVICFFVLPAQAKYGGGTGEPNDPYLIYTAEQMNAIGADANDWDKYFKLMADIDLGQFTGEEFNIIGDKTTKFTGVFDGNGQTISNFTYDSNGTNYIGLFGYVRGVIRDLGLIDSNVDAGTGWNIGSMVGYLNGSVTGCYAEGGSVSGTTNIGGLVGYSVFGGTITNCYSTGTVSGDEGVGGLVGRNGLCVIEEKCYVGTISNCYSTGSVTGDYYVGGLVGYNDGEVSTSYSTGSVIGNGSIGGLVGVNYCIVSNSYSTGSVSGDSRVGGLVGRNSDWNIRSTIINCYSTGSVSGGSSVGGLVGYNYYGTVTVSFWDIETSGLSDGGMGKTTLQMHTASTFIPWGCNPVWTIDEGNDYPRLVWENKPGELITTPSYGGGSGEPNDPYLIYTAEQLNTIGLIPCHRDEHFKLMDDIDLSGFTGEAFNIIGINYHNPFTGVFDGNGHTISNFTYTSTGPYIGLFRYVTGDIKNLGLIAPDVDAGTGDYVGSLVGYLEQGTITKCYAEAGSVSGDSRVGGLVGHNDGWGIITNSYSTCSVSGDWRVGGLVGENAHGTITNCYSTGRVTATSEVGGLVGHHGLGYVNNSFWDIETSGQTTSARGTGLTTAEMQTAITFVCHWSYEPVWTIDEGVDYPRLWWESKPGEPITTPSYGGGNGVPNDPYLIYTANQLNMIGLIPCHWDKHFLLCADIDLSDFTGTSFNIIGNWDNPFSGVFDGNGHTISNFIYTSTGTNYIGLFGYVGGRPGNRKIKNLDLVDPNIDSGNGNYVGGVVGYLERGIISNCCVYGGRICGGDSVGGIVGLNGRCDEGHCHGGTISNCYSTSDVSGGDYVGGLVGGNFGTTTNCYSTGSVSGNTLVGGLAGGNDRGTITNCYSSGSVSGSGNTVGGLVGGNFSTITNCYSTDSVSGNYVAGGLVGYNGGTIANCYSTGSVMGNSLIGGLVGMNGSFSEVGTIANCYSSGSISGNNYVGGLVGRRDRGWIYDSFWDIETSGQATSDGGIGLPTAEMQMQVTFTDASWDFNTPVWTIEDGVDYPRLWWELVPVLHAEPEITLGTINTIFWEPVIGDIEYYAECAEDANFTRIVYNSGWISETSCEFTGLELGQRYWYSVKARNSAGIETAWSNVESSLQGTLADAVQIELELESLKNANMKNALLNKIDAALKMIEEGSYTGALSKLQHDILQKTNGCAETGEPDKNDWIITCEQQNEIYPLIIETIEHVKALMAE